MSDTTQATMLELTAQIVTAHVEHNEVASEDIPTLIKSVYTSLATAAEGRADGEQVIKTASPTVPIKKSVFPDYIVCLEDGRKLKMLKRHLKVSFNMTPDEYRAKWRLPYDYPMIAPNYASQRSALAVSIGLGKKVDTEPKVTVGRARRAKGSRG